jgi:ABC-type transporter Mla MlaB component
VPGNHNPLDEAFNPSTGCQLKIQPLADREGFRLVGDVDLVTIGKLEAALASTACGRADVHIDAGRLSFIDAAGMAALVRCSTRLGAGRRMILHHPPVPLKRVIELMWGSLPTMKLETS